MIYDNRFVGSRHGGREEWIRIPNRIAQWARFLDSDMRHDQTVAQFHTLPKSYIVTKCAVLDRCFPMACQHSPNHTPTPNLNTQNCTTNWWLMIIVRVPTSALPSSCCYVEWHLVNCFPHAKGATECKSNSPPRKVYDWPRNRPGPCCIVEETTFRPQRERSIHKVCRQEQVQVHDSLCAKAPSEGWLNFWLTWGHKTNSASFW